MSDELDEMEVDEESELVEAASETATPDDEADGMEYSPAEPVAEKPAPAAKAKKAKATPPAATPEKIVNPLLGEPYDFDHCTAALQIVFLPDDGHPCGREVVVGARSHNGAPIIKVFRMQDVWPLSPPFENVLTELRQTIADAGSIAAAMAAAAPAVPEPTPEPAPAPTPEPTPEPIQQPKQAEPKPAPEPVVLPPAHPRADLPPVANAKQLDIFNSLFGG